MIARASDFTRCMREHKGASVACALQGKPGSAENLWSAVAMLPPFALANTSLETALAREEIRALENKISDKNKKSSHECR
jgi:hypothetical protein